MCGFCTETALIDHTLRALQGEAAVPVDAFLRPIFLQEVRDWQGEVRLLGDGCSDSLAMIALCRHWSARLTGETPRPLAELLAPSSVTALQRWLEPLDYAPEWQWLLQIDGPLPDPLPTDAANKQLGEYAANALQPSPSPDQASHRNELALSFLRVSAAFDIVCKGDDAELPARLAITAPSGMPGFDALGLWLQRRALQECVRRFGLRFIADNLAGLRIEAILSVVMADSLAPSELLELKGVVAGRRHDTSNLSSADLLAGIEAMLGR